MLSNSFSLSFAQKWQQIAEEQAEESRAILRREGIDFWDAALAHKYRMLREDLRSFEADGDTKMAADIMLELDAIRIDDEALDRRNWELLKLDNLPDGNDPDYLYEQYHDQADALYWASFAEADAAHAQGGEVA